MIDSNAPLNAPSDDPAAQRARLRRARAALPRAYRNEASRLALQRLIQTPWFPAARHIGLYLPFGAEADPLHLFDLTRGVSKVFHVPILSSGNSNQLMFGPLARAGCWRTNRFGIAEPRLPAGLLRRPIRLDLVVMPLAGFDPACNRLGMGGGFYDRSFAFRNGRGRWRRPRQVGVAFEAQKLDRLPAADWDVPLDAVVTERATYFRDRPTGY